MNHKRMLLRRRRNFSETAKDRVGPEPLIKHVVTERHPDHVLSLDACYAVILVSSLESPDCRFWPDRVRPSHGRLGSNTHAFPAPERSEPLHAFTSDPV